MAYLAVNHNLRTAAIRLVLAVVGGVNALLQLKHHRAGGIDNLNAVAAGNLISFGWLAVRTQQHLHIVQAAQVVVSDSHQALGLQSFHLV